jgi:hypothetical protein
MVSRCLRRVGFNVRLVDDHRRIKRPAIVSFTWQLDDPKLLSHSVVWDPWKRCFIDPSVSNGRVSPKEADEFIDLWVRTNGKSMIVTGRIRSSH